MTGTERGTTTEQTGAGDDANNRNRIFNELRKIQEECGGYIPEVELYKLAARLQKLDYSNGLYIGGVCDVYSVATFYPEFRFKKPPKVEVKVCTALPCFLKGAEIEYQKIARMADASEHLEAGRCPCLGKCDAAPAMTVNGHIFDAPRDATLSDVAGKYMQWAALSSGEQAAVTTIAAATAAPIDPKEPPHHGHHIHPPTGIPRFDEIGRDEKHKGNYRTDPYASIDEHYSELRKLVTESQFRASQQAARDDVKAEGARKRGPKTPGGATAATPPASDAPPPPPPAKRGVQLVREQLKKANLRGMGGAGKPFLRKFDQVLSANAAERFVVVNADESEPGTLKDREIMLRLTHCLVEGLAIAGIAAGAKKGFIYIRHEYEAQAAAIYRELRWAYAEEVIGSDGQRRKKDRFLGKNILGSGIDFDIELFISPGGYVMGEQSALLNAIEGFRGMPRNGIQDLGADKGLPTGRGLWGMPTAVSNVETYTYIPVIMHKGGQWFSDQGVNGCQGIKWASVCGDVENPGVFETVMGTTFRDYIAQAGPVTGGRKMKSFAPSGPSFGFLPATDKFLDLPIDFPGEDREGKPNPIKAAGATIGSGAIIVLAEGRSIVEGALNFTRFFRNESCGKCVPCRVGSQKMVDVIKQIRNDTYQANRAEILRLQSAGDEEGLAALIERLRAEHIGTVEQLSTVLESTSICGLGKVVHLPIQTVLKHFPEEIAQHLRGDYYDTDLDGMDDRVQAPHVAANPAHAGPTAANVDVSPAQVTVNGGNLASSVANKRADGFGNHREGL